MLLNQDKKQLNDSVLKNVLFEQKKVNFWKQQIYLLP